MSVVKEQETNDLPRDIDALIALIAKRDSVLEERDEQIAVLKHVVLTKLCTI